MVADPCQALGLAAARMIRDRLHRARPVHARAPGGGVVRAPRGPSGSANSQTVPESRRAYS